MTQSGTAGTLVIAVTGTMTSGKAAVKYFLVDKGFQYIRHTDPILQEGLKRKLDMKDRQNWIDVLVDMRKKEGMDILSKKASKLITEGERYVICPIRHPAEIEYLKKKYDALVIFVEADFDTRYKRTFLKELGGGMTKEEFKAKDDQENNPKGPDREYLPNLSACKKLADIVIDNDGSLNDLNLKLTKFLEKRQITDIVDTGTFDDFEI
ncbi:MAG: hypothetical protein PHS44_01090 [Candidatus Dojkabacteria bacterium]|nr:hypothetical protein [Candidatus Dojkabacteria bacterium]